MSLRGSEEEELEPLFVEIPHELAEYVRSATKQEKKTKRGVVIAALELDRDLAEELKSLDAQIKAYATGNHLKMSRDLGRILAGLVRLGLQSLQRDK